MNYSNSSTPENRQAKEPAEVIPLETLESLMRGKVQRFQNWKGEIDLLAMSNFAPDEFRAYVDLRVEIRRRKLAS